MENKENHPEKPPAACYLSYFFVCLHLGGLILHEIVEKAGLFSSMIHGKKYFPKEKI